MLQNCARRLRAHHSQPKSIATGTDGWRRSFAALPQAVIKNVSNTSQATDRDAHTESQAATTDVELPMVLWAGLGSIHQM